MSNTLRSNIFIIDSSGVYLTSDFTATGTYPDFAISAVGFFGASTTSEIGLSLLSANSADIFHLKTTAPTGGYDEMHFSNPIRISERVYVRLLTAGTGFLYLS